MPDNTCSFDNHCATIIIATLVPFLLALLCLYRYIMHVEMLAAFSKDRKPGSDINVQTRVDKQVASVADSDSDPRYSTQIRYMAGDSVIKNGAPDA